jgi:hypothetical protein
MSISGIGGVFDAISGGAESVAGSAFESALSALGLGGQQPDPAQGMLGMMEPMLMNMASQTQKIISGNSSGML